MFTTFGIPALHFTCAAIPLITVPLYRRCSGNDEDFDPNTNITAAMPGRLGHNVCTPVNRANTKESGDKREDQGLIDVHEVLTTR